MNNIAIKSTSKAEQARSIQGSLTCNHCKCTFAGTARQVKSVVYEGKNTYCSSACRYSFIREKFSIPMPNRGACGGCGEEFYSRREAKFCGMKCYTGSTQFTDMLADSRAKFTTPEIIAKRAASQLRGEGKPCLECGSNVYVKKSELKKKFCSKGCYRSYMAKRFDRQIASPDQMTLPQGYDAFLDRNELNCLITGCDWTGKHLSVHMNAAHGIRADDFKRAAGFNKSTGVVSKDSAQALRERSLQGVALDCTAWGTAESMTAMNNRIKYNSTEGSEHRAKARALAGNGPSRTCSGCGCVFTQSTPFGKTLYCTKECRADAYSKIRAECDGVDR